MCKLSELKFVDIYYNYLNGTIPPKLGNLSKLKHLALGGSLSDITPTSLGHLLELTYLELRFSSLNETIPTFLGKLSKLGHVLQGGSHSDTILVFLDKLSKLTYLDLSYNSISGHIPTFLGKLSKLTYLDLSSNSLTSHIPTFLGKLSKLTYLFLRYNSLNDTIPTFLGKLTKLTTLDLRHNPLNGTLTLSIFDKLHNIQELSLSWNTLTIKVNATYIPNFQLEYMDSRSCNRQGNFPAFISTQYFLHKLDLSENSLRGSIPNWLWDSRHLYYLNLVSLW